jgi:hypothetical protein
MKELRKEFENLSIGVSTNIWQALKSIPTKTPSNSLYGINLFLNDIYPITLKDGTIIDGVMIGANGSKVFMIRVPKEQ